MIEITKGTLSEQIIRILQKNYPITVEEVSSKLHISKKTVLMELKRLQIKKILILEPLPDKTYIRLLRNDFSFIGKKRQKKFIKHHSSKKKQGKKKDNDDIMFS